MSCALCGVANAQPKYVVYYNSDATPLSALVGSPYTHVILSFARPVLKSDGSLDLILNKRLTPFWGDVPALIDDGKKVMISFGGGLAQNADYKLAAGREQELAKLLGAFVKDHSLHGVDLDYEASDTFQTKRPADVIDGVSFLVALTAALRSELPTGEWLISHTPQPPYLDARWHDGPYLKILAQVGSDIDFLSVQYYDNPGFDSTANVLGIANTFPTSYTALVEAQNGPRWPSEKLLVGKPIYHADANSGHIAPSIVIKDIVEPLKARYGDQFGGLMGWQYSNLTSDHQSWNSAVGSALLEPAAPNDAG